MKRHFASSAAVRHVRHAVNSPAIAALLYGVNALVVAGGFVIVAYWGVRAMKSVAENQLRSDLAASAVTIGGILESEAFIGTFHSLLPIKNAAKERITLVSQDGSVVWDTATDDPLENHLDRPEIKAVFEDNAYDKTSFNDEYSEYGESSKYSDIRRSTVTGDDVMYYAIPITIAGEIYALRLSSQMRRTVYYTRLVRKHTLFAAAAVMAAVLILTYGASSFIVRGINTLRKEAAALKTGNLDCHISFNAPYEVLLLQGDMERMAQEVKRLEQVRKDFVANVSHELKTPVTAIIGFSETLLDLTDDDNSDNRRFLQIIHTEAKRLIAIIEDLLTLSRLERDSRKPEMLMCDMASLTQTICKRYEDRATERKMCLAFHAANIDSAFCMANERLYEEALGNIIDNAIKYCPEGSHIEVNMQLASNSSGAPSDGISLPSTDAAWPVIRTIVEDDGLGIPERYRQRVFERFFRVDKGRSRDMGGTGLGLSIAAHIIKAHGGNLICEPRPDGKSGARFVLEIPVC